MTATLGRRLARLEEARTARALADFRAAFHAWAERADDRPTPEEVDGRAEALRAGLSPVERASSDRLTDALGMLLAPATAGAGVVRAAAVVAEVEEFGLGPGTPLYLVLETLAAHFRAWCPADEGRGVGAPVVPTPPLGTTMLGAPTPPA